MNQPLLGVLKGFTCGGCGIWFLIDLVVIGGNLLSKAPSINSAGYVATWDPDTISTAFTLAAIFLPLYACCCCCSCCLYGTAFTAAIAGAGNAKVPERDEMPKFQKVKNVQ